MDGRLFEQWQNARPETDEKEAPQVAFEVPQVKERGRAD
jgi:hypothetical protein